MKTEVRMEDVAKRAGVARSTVSMALRNDASIPASTRERIQKVAEEMGYRPNPMVSALMAELRTGRKEMRPISLAFVSTFSEDETRDKATLWRFQEGGRDIAKRLGYRVEHFRLSETSMTPARLSQVLRARGISGFALTPFVDPVYDLEFDWNSFAAVAIGHSVRRPQLHRAMHHHYHGVTLAVEKLHQLGYERVGMAITSLVDERIDHNWTAAFLVQQMVRGKGKKMPLLVAKTWSEETFCRWFEREKPDAIISVFQDVPMWLQKLGYRVPEDVGFAVLDWYPGMPWPGIDQNSELVSAAAIDLLVEQLYHNRYGIPKTPKSVFIEGRWVDPSVPEEAESS